jgi:hypothetical protein
VVRPLIEATRQKMLRGEADSGSSQYEPDALVTLIQLESDVLSRGMTPANTGTVNPITPGNSSLPSKTILRARK